MSKHKRPVGKEKTIEIDIDDKTKKNFTVFEIRPYDVLKIAEQGDVSTLDFINKILDLCSTLTIGDLQELYPSDLEKIYEAFKELNRPFFRGVQAMGLDGLIQEKIPNLKKYFLTNIEKTFSEAFVTVSSTGTKMRSTTGGATTKKR